MNLDILTDGTPDTKPWLSIVCDSVDAVSSNTKYPATSTNTSWNGALAVVPTVLQNEVPPGIGGTIITYCNTRDEVIQSGLAGVTTSALTTNGSDWGPIATPISNPSIMWSPTLNIYSVINGAGSDVYTSPDCTVFTIGTPFVPGFFINSGFMWSTVFNKFISSTADVNNYICDSSDGVTYTSRASTRVVQKFAESPKLGRLIAVGDNGAQYTDDGKTWIPCVQIFSASAAAWSDTFDCFVTIPRNGTKTECWRSSDGITWTVTNPFSGLNNLRALTWGQDLGLFVAGGDDSYVAFSQDGYTWRRAEVGGLIDSYGAEYITTWGQYMLVGIGGFVLTNGKRFRTQA